MRCEHAAADSSSSYLSAWQQQGWLPALLLAPAIFLACQLAWHAGFIWDDDYYLTQNPCVVGPPDRSSITNHQSPITNHRPQNP
jgi:hypothetical protein